MFLDLTFTLFQLKRFSAGSVMCCTVTVQQMAVWPTRYTETLVSVQFEITSCNSGDSKCLSLYLFISFLYPGEAAAHSILCTIFYSTNTREQLTAATGDSIRRDKNITFPPWSSAELHLQTHSLTADFHTLQDTDSEWFTTAHSLQTHLPTDKHESFCAWPF